MKPYLSPTAITFLDEATRHLAASSEMIVEEKIDGSQFSCRKDTAEGLICSSRRMRISPSTTSPVSSDVERQRREGEARGATRVGSGKGMFQTAIDSVREVENLLIPDWTYRFEFVSKPKHNVLTYSRVPPRYLVLFDVEAPEDEGSGSRPVSYVQKVQEGRRLGFDVPQLFYRGPVKDLDVSSFLSIMSAYGNSTIEGVVIKLTVGTEMTRANYKIVRPDLREKQSSTGKSSKPVTVKDLKNQIISEYKTIPRVQKAMAHLQESQPDRGKFTVSEVEEEVKRDVREEAGEEIKERVVPHGDPDQTLENILKGIAGGIGKWMIVRTNCVDVL